MLDEKFKVIRTLVALSHIDGQLTKEELAYLQKLVKQQPFDEQQKKQLEIDYQTPQDPFALFQAIAEPRNRRWLLDAARILFFKDGDFSGNEKKALEQMQDLHSNTLDLKKIVADAQMAGQKLAHEMATQRKDQKSQPMTFRQGLEAFLK